MNDGFEARFQDALSTLVSTRAPETDDVRATALNTLADLILETARTGEQRVPAHFTELMQALLPRVGAHVRETISRRLAPCDLVSADIARHFIAETSEIAGPMLRQSPVLTRDDLLTVATGDCNEKARAVASRTDLTADTLFALVERRDPVIGASLALSQTPLIDEALAERIAAIPNLPRVAARRLIGLAELSDAALAQLFWLVEEDARRDLIERIMSRRGEGTPTDEEPRKADDASADTQLGDALFALAAAGDRAEIAKRLAGALSLPRTLGARIVGDLQGDALTIGLRAAGVGADRATGIILLTVTEAGRSYDLLRTLAGLAEAISVETARFVVDLWARHEAGDRPAARHAPAVARPATRPYRTADTSPSKLEDVVADISRRTGS